jgi:RNA polymerase sporulation-specific sigma factor
MNEEIYQIIKENEKLIFKIASRFYGIDLEDLYQAGTIGLIKAYKNFKDNKECKFMSYAYDYIFGEMYNLALSSRSIKVNKETLKFCRKIEETRISLAQVLNRIPSNTELALFLEIDEHIINNTILATENILSLDEEGEVNLYDVIPERKTVNIDESIIINDSMVVLNEEEKNIIKYRYFKDYTQSETAKILGITQTSVSRFEKKGLQKMNDYIMT